MGVLLHRSPRRSRRSPTTDMAGDPMTERTRTELLTIPQVAARLKVTPRTVYRLISAGDLPVVEVGSVSRVSEEALKQYIDRNTRVAS